MTTAQIAAVLAGTVLPLLVGLLTKASTNPILKSLLLLALSAGTTAAASVASGADLKASLAAGALAYVTAVAAHYGLLKPSGASAAVANTLIKDEPTPADTVFTDPPSDPGAQEEVIDPDADGTDIPEGGYN
jgi:hypothetical protein